MLAGANEMTCRAKLNGSVLSIVIAKPALPSCGRPIEPMPGAPTKRAFNAFLKAYEKGILIRTTGDIIAMSPPLIIEKAHIDQLVGTIKDVLDALD